MNMKNIKKVISAFLAAALCFATVSAHPFSDISGHWAEEQIGAAYESKVVSGDPDGRFRPDDTVSRAEFLKMLTSEICTRMEVEIPEAFADKDGHWASKFYNFASSQIYLPLSENEKVGELIPGEMKDNSFDLPIQRWEMAYLVGEAMANVFSAGGKGDYADRTEVEADYPAAVSSTVSSCVYLGIINGDENGRFNPSSCGTRAEAAVMIGRTDSLISEILAYYDAQQKAYEQQQAELEKTNITYTDIPSGHPVVTIVMSDNRSIKLELYPEYAPQTVANFVSLVKSGFYDGLTFHRVVEGFMAQGGDPNGDGTGGSGHTIKGEFAANGFEDNTLSHTRGVVSMARSAFADSASSQFFICYDDASFLDGQYAAFGKVISGMDTVDGFLKHEMTVNSSGEKASPVTPIVMKKVTVNR